MGEDQLVADPSALDALARALERQAYSIESQPVPQVTAIVAAALPGSPLVNAVSTATQTLQQSVVAVSGQWETLAATVRTFRTVVEGEDSTAATKMRSLASLPDGTIR